MVGAARDVEAELEAASIFILSSRIEGLPLALLEAMGEGLAVVSFESAARGLIEDGVDGLLALAWVSRRALPAALAVVAAASFAYAVIDVRAAPEAAYYSAFARAWELALGALLAVLPGLRLPRSAAWLGLGAIVAATATFGADTPFPGPAALVPTLGAAAVIAAGASVPPRSLTLRPVRWVGRVSYAWYVWHWPVPRCSGSPASSRSRGVAGAWSSSPRAAARGRRCTWRSR